MILRRTSAIARWMFVAVALSALPTTSCRSGSQTGGGESNLQPAGEPEQYSATVVRIVDDGANRETSITREARSGDQRREEWTEGGLNRALIWRPEIGKSFLLDLDRQVYVEEDVWVGASQNGANVAQSPTAGKSSAVPETGDRFVQTIDQYFDDSQPPTRIETRELPAAVIDGHKCVVYERRSIYPDGHIEITRRFQAPDLSGMLLRVESETNQSNSRVTTERRDVRTEVASDTFLVPADFKRVEKLRR